MIQSAKHRFLWFHLCQAGNKIIERLQLKQIRVNLLDLGQFLCDHLELSHLLHHKEEVPLKSFDVRIHGNVLLESHLLVAVLNIDNGKI